MVIAPESLANMNAEQLRELTSDLIAKVANKDRELVFRSTKIDQLTHEIAVLKRLASSAVAPRARMTCITSISQLSEERGHHAMYRTFT